MQGERSEDEMNESILEYYIGGCKNMKLNEKEFTNLKRLSTPYVGCDCNNCPYFSQRNNNKNGDSRENK